MSKRIKVMSVFGTRPEAIKMAPLVLELQKHPEIESIVCITAQHREMLDSVMDCFGIRADYDLNIMQQGQDLTAITTRVLERMREVLSEVQPDIVLVHGDTTTTFAGALAAFYAKIPVGHVEAGLRTYDRWSPFPEEMNRSLVGRIATLHFAPTANNAHNLEREAVEGDIFVTGNTVIDAMAYTVRGEQFVSDELRQVDFSRRVIAMTCHRRENYGQPMRNIFTAVRRLALNYPDVEIVYPVHLSPVVRSTAEELLGGVPNIRLIAPLDAVDMHRLMARSYMVMTDSGGIQEEAPALGKTRARAPARDGAAGGRHCRHRQARRHGHARRSTVWLPSCWTIRPPMTGWPRPSTPMATGGPARASRRRSEAAFSAHSRPSRLCPRTKETASRRG